jgi:ADP-glucose pyrophosphorylase
MVHSHCTVVIQTDTNGHVRRTQDYSHVVATHRQTGADITIVTHSIEERDAGRRGVMRVNPDSGGRPKQHAGCRLG